MTRECMGATKSSAPAAVSKRKRDGASRRRRDIDYPAVIDSPFAGLSRRLRRVHSTVSLSESTDREEISDPSSVVNTGTAEHMRAGEYW